MEKEILKELKWPVNRKNYLGTLVYNLENTDKENFSDIVINRNEKEIIVDFIDLKDDSKISLVINRRHYLLIDSLHRVRRYQYLSPASSVHAFFDKPRSIIRHVPLSSRHRQETDNRHNLRLLTTGLWHRNHNSV